MTNAGTDWTARTYTVARLAEPSAAREPGTSLAPATQPVAPSLFIAPPGDAVLRLAIISLTDKELARIQVSSTPSAPAATVLLVRPVLNWAVLSPGDRCRLIAPQPSGAQHLMQTDQIPTGFALNSGMPVALPPTRCDWSFGMAGGAERERR